MNSLFQPTSTKGCEASLINAIYDAAMHPHLWPQVLDAIREFCGADQCTVFYYDGVERQRNYAAAARLKVQTLDLYLDEFIAPQAAQLNNQLRCLPEGKVVTDEDIGRLSGKSYAQIVGSKYMQCLWPKLHFQAGTVLFRSASGSAGLGLQNFENSPQLNATSIERLQRLTPHLIQAIHIRQRINLLEKANHAFEAVLKHLRLGVVLLDEYEQLTFINPEAMRAFSKCADVYYKLHQRLHFSKYTFDQNSGFLAKEKATPKEKQKNHEKRKIEGNEACVKIEYPQGHLKISFFTIGVAHREAHGHHGENGVPVKAHYLVLVQDSHRPCDLPIHYLKQAYGITPAEGELINHMMNGATLIEAAEKRAVTHETARWQMKNIMQKTQVHSQTQLSQLMLSLMEG
jgi:DNA-binding CsgD family transcriptional regulator